MRKLFSIFLILILLLACASIASARTLVVDGGGVPVAGGGTWGPTGIAATGDDGDEVGGTWSDTGGLIGNLMFVGDTGSSMSIGVRFVNITIPQGATITDAELNVYNTSDENSGTSAGTVSAWDVDNAGQYSGANIPSSVTKTTATAVFTPLQGAGWVTVDVTSIVGEVIARGGWSSGNAINFAIVETVASGNWASFEDYSHASTHHATLEITYE